MPSPLLDPRYTAKFYIAPDGGVDSRKGGESRTFKLELPLPEEVSFGIRSHWEPFTDQGLLGLMDKVSGTLVGRMPGKVTRKAFGAGKLAVKATNNNLYIAELSHQWWKGTDPISFNLRFNLVAINSAKVDVVDKISALGALVLPQKLYQTGTFLGMKATILSAPPRDISLHLGTVLRFGAVIIESVDIQWDSKFDANGFPISAIVTVGILTSYVPNASQFNLAQGVSGYSNKDSEALAEAGVNSGFIAGG